MKLRDIMSKEIASLKQDDSIEAAAQLMKQHDVGSIPITNQGKIIGIVTDRDITLRSVASNNQSKSVKEVMTSNPAVGSPEMDVHEAARIMGEKQIRRLPVVENNCLVGMVSLGDISVESKLQDNAEVALKNISKPSSNAFK